MKSAPVSSLQWPPFLHGTYASVQDETREEGLRCGDQYRKRGSFSLPLQVLEVSPSDVVVTHEVADFQREHPAWRLYMVSHVMRGLREALDWQNTLPLRDAYETVFRDTAWGALFFAIAQMGPVSARHTAPRLEAVLRFWEPLESARYLFKTPGQQLTLDELMDSACGWAMEAWSPQSDGTIRERLARAAQSMAHATRQESLEAILRQMPRVLPLARNLKHRAFVADPSFQRERLCALDDWAFERVSGACTADLLGQLYAWDRELERH